jgi:hypothetical protein
VPPSALRPSTSAWISSRSSVGGSIVCGSEENATAPTRASSGTSSRKRWAAARAASSRLGSTSSASIERDTSVTSTIEACSFGTATVACGRAIAIVSTASEVRKSTSGSCWRQPGTRGRSGASVATPGKRTA